MKIKVLSLATLAGGVILFISCLKKQNNPQGTESFKVNRLLADKEKAKNGSKDPWVYYELANESRSVGNIEKSLQYWKKACELDPRNSQFKLEYATILYFTKKRENVLLALGICKSINLSSSSSKAETHLIEIRIRDCENFLKN
jgi:tetratricopeptide (TPR) repeat protein